MTDAERIYCIDTSALVWLQRNFDKKVFADVWEAVADVVRAGRMFAPAFVLEEIDRGADDLGQWCRQFRYLFRHPIVEVANVVGQLGAKHLGFVNTLQAPDEADPWIVAWALHETQRLTASLFGGECIVVASEGSRHNHIADVCGKEGVRCIQLQVLFELEGLSFKRAGA